MEYAPEDDEFAPEPSDVAFLARRLWRAVHRHCPNGNTDRPRRTDRPRCRDCSDDLVILTYLEYVVDGKWAE